MGEEAFGDGLVVEPGESNKTLGSHNISGYLCHIKLEANFGCAPETLFALFCNPDNSRVFRDVKRVNSRRTLKEEKDWRLVEIEQVGEAKVFFKKLEFKTLLEVEEDGRNPESLVASFKLIRSDLLNKFNGSWTVYPAVGARGARTTRAVLEQDLLPKGVPTWLKHVPIAGGALRGVSVRAVERLLQDVESALNKLGSGTSWEAVLGPPSISKEKVGSHAVESFSSDEER